MSYSNVLRGAAAFVGVLIAAQSMAAAPEEGRVCRYESRPGSRILSHACLTAAQWAEIDKRQTGERALLSPASLPQGEPSTVSGGGASQNWGGFQRY
jgi:hypothetical protein